MTQFEAIQARHSVRHYLAKPIGAEELAALQREIVRVNAESGLHVQLLCGESKAFSVPMGYGKFSGVENYLVMAGPKSGQLDFLVGYYGEQLVLLAQQLGLNAGWAAVSYRKVQGTYELAPGEKIACYIAIGYGQTQGVPHRSKAPEELSNLSADSPEWFRRGVKAALLAPTAVNQQKFRIELKDVSGYGAGLRSAVDMADSRAVAASDAGAKDGGSNSWAVAASDAGAKDGGSDSRAVVSISKGVSLIGYTQMDMGIAKLHFEIGAGTENFRWDL